MTETVAPAAQIGGPHEVLTDEQILAFVQERLAAADLDGRSVCVLVPDGTRSCPLPLLLSAVHRALHGRVTRLTVLVALGTHAEMSEPALAAHLGYEPGASADRHPGTTVLNHAWWDRSAFAAVGTIPAERIAELSDGMLRQGADVRINRAVVEHDVTLIVGPVFPHEVVGFSGGNKYLFLGVSGRELIDRSHWLGALITSARIIGTRGITPVRALIDEAASMVPGERLAFCVVTRSGAGDLHSIAFGDAQAAWAAAADVAAESHVHYLDAPVRRVLSLLPAKYDDMWTGAKGFYKVEAIVADGGQVVIPPTSARSAPPSADPRDRVSLPRLLRQAVGSLQGPALGRSRPLHAPARRRHMGRGGGRAQSRHGHARHRPPRGHHPLHQPRLPRSGRGRSHDLGRRPRHARRARRRRGPLPAPLTGGAAHGPARERRLGDGSADEHGGAAHAG
jgi:nickel-dependent lactate racemase